jgi:hypothetical protein
MWKYTDVEGDMPHKNRVLSSLQVHKIILNVLSSIAYRRILGWLWKPWIEKKFNAAGVGFKGLNQLLHEKAQKTSKNIRPNGRPPNSYVKPGPLE